MRLIDTHCHLYLPEFNIDLADVFKRAEAAGVEKFYLPSIDSSVSDDLLKMEREYPGKCLAMAGLHPCSVNANYKNELQQVEDLLQTRQFPAIGEIGLDFYWSEEFISQQYEAF